MNQEPLMYKNLMACAVSEMVNYGMSEVESRIIADGIIRSFCDHHSDEIYRVPTLRSLIKRERDQRIIDESETMNKQELAKKYDMHPTSIKAIIREHKSAPMDFSGIAG